MEDTVGGWWDVLIRKAAYRGYPAAAVQLEEMERLAPVFFRAMGGEPGLHLRSTVGTEHAGRRTWLERVAGTNTSVELAWSDERSLYLPGRIDLFPDRTRNQQLYLWLLALSAEHAQLMQECTPPPGWLESNRLATLRCLHRMPGMALLYAGLVRDYLPLRGDPASLPPAQQAIEQMLRDTLRDPGHAPEARAVAGLESRLQGITPVPLWMHPAPPAQASPAGRGGDEAANREAEEHQQDSQEARKRRYRAQRVTPDERKNGPLLIFRAESIFTWDNYLRMNRNEDDEDMGDLRAAEDMDHLVVTRDTRRRASRVKFDLDLPSAEADDIPVGPGMPLPEWNYKTGTLVPGHCLLKPMRPRDASPVPLPEPLRETARRLRRQFQALAPQRSRRFAQPEGQDLDLDRVVRFFTDMRAGQADSGEGLYVEMPRSQRSLACLLLADVSLSTEAWVGRGEHASTVISVIRDSLMLFAEALQASGDSFGLYGFSSLKRKEVRYLLLKDFGEPYDAAARGRIAALRPGYYTRMGAAIRQSTRILREQPAHKRLLLLVTDGKPNDLDHYEGRYGVEDTREAVREAREAGLVPFCVTIDREAAEYLPHLFGAHHYVVVHDATRLPQVLTRLYAALSQ